VAAKPVSRVSDPQAIALVENYLKAIGGKEVLAKIKDRTTFLRNVKHSPTGEQEVAINLYVKDGIYFREEWDIKGFAIKDAPLAFTQIYNGEEGEGWVAMLGTVSPLDGRTLQIFVHDKQMDDFFLHWEQDGYNLQLGGDGLIPKEINEEDEACSIVNVVDFAQRAEQKFFFSKKSGLLLKKEWQDEGPNTKGRVKKEKYFKRYRDIPFLDGSGLAIKYSMFQEIYMDGDLDAEWIFTTVKFNAGLSPKLFAKPEGTPFDKAVTESPKGPPAPEKSGIHNLRGKAPVPVQRPGEGPAAAGGDPHAAPKVVPGPTPTPSGKPEEKAAAPPATGTK
jgi:hypothetical protein